MAPLKNNGKAIGMVVRKTCWILFPTLITESVFSLIARGSSTTKKLRIAHSARVFLRGPDAIGGRLTKCSLSLFRLLSFVICAAVTGERLLCSDISSRQQHVLKSQWV